MRVSVVKRRVVVRPSRFRSKSCEETAGGGEGEGNAIARQTGYSSQGERERDRDLLLPPLLLPFLLQVRESAFLSVFPATCAADVAEPRENLVLMWHGPGRNSC